MSDSKSKPTGLTQDAGWQIGARRIFTVDPQRAWELLTSPPGLEIWLGGVPDVPFNTGAKFALPDGTQVHVRVFKPGSHLRCGWAPPTYPRASTIQVRVIPQDTRSTVAFHQEHLPDQEARLARREFFQSVLDQLESLFNSS